LAGASDPATSAQHIANGTQIVSDFDGVTFHISTPETKSKILVSLRIKCYQELVQYGAQSVLEREYGPYIVEPESGYDFSVLVDLDNLPEDQGMINPIPTCGAVLIVV
jgi:actin related protein 2/3 complex subunit 2